MGRHYLPLSFQHILQAREHPQLSQPVRVNLHALLRRPIISITELNLSGAQRRDEMPPRLLWDVDCVLGPDCDSKQGGRSVSSRNSSSSGRENKWLYTPWEDHVDRGTKCDIWAHGEVGPGGEVELCPMEIRTWELVLA